MRRVLVTGANKGIGLAIVSEILQSHGDTAVLLGARDLGRGRAARESLLAREPSWQDRVQVLQIDVADDASVANAAAEVAAQFGAEAPLYGWGGGSEADCTDENGCPSHEDPHLWFDERGGAHLLTHDQNNHV